MLWELILNGIISVSVLVEPMCYLENQSKHEKIGAVLVSDAGENKGWGSREWANGIRGC